MKQFVTKKGKTNFPWVVKNSVRVFKNTSTFNSNIYEEIKTKTGLEALLMKSTHKVLIYFGTNRICKLQL